MPSVTRRRPCSWCGIVPIGTNICLCPGAHAARERRVQEAMRKRLEPTSPRVREALAKLTPEDAAGFWK